MFLQFLCRRMFLVASSEVGSRSGIQKTCLACVYFVAAFTLCSVVAAHVDAVAVPELSNLVFDDRRR